MRKQQLKKKKIMSKKCEKFLLRKAEKALKVYANDKHFVEVYKYDKTNGEIIIDTGNLNFPSLIDVEILKKLDRLAKSGSKTRVTIEVI